MAIRHWNRPAGRLALMALALALGLMIAFADSSQGWDSTGVTAGALLLVGGTASFLRRHRPWLWALLVGLPTPVIEIAGGGSNGALLALVFASIGAAAGWALARAG
jgi:hypothetical protein